MKASLKFREDQKPLLRAKIPLTILGLPFQSAIAAGTSKELTLKLSTLFESGPSFNLAYRPNDSSNPFSVIVKTGIASFGSPISSPMLMSAEFNLIASGNPTFMLHFKPKLGDFSVKKSQSSSVMFQKVPKSEEEPVDVKTAVSKAVSGLEVAVSTAVPIMKSGAVRFRWGLRVPAAEGMKMSGGISFREVPFMVMDKIGFEHVDGGDMSTKEGSLGNGDLNLDSDCFSVKRQFEVLKLENGLLKKSIDDLRKQMKLFSNSGRRLNDRNAPELGGFDGLPPDDKAAGVEELRKPALPSA
ncbi:uncharacterized protein E5676_scaffold83G001320 [Cucumis melo var. makuwa]|uniref:Uncharacterized protein LOC103486052 n=2 Tax=Cucumis melo TaxID=3656 RepID=A0A1S3B5N3_CUCME|nr:uncharacterized protein LOC103486052 [Cucumis melo]KAA0034881.1 uncharacterized protein E6C27_scaffold103G00070 [Cucumis melo var. makuwa]TYK05434.1 uncharacterized protein E5676_scaffold83G001320 [Cucumis melo var. makuwa]